MKNFFVSAGVAAGVVALALYLTASPPETPEPQAVNSTPVTPVATFLPADPPPTPSVETPKAAPPNVVLPRLLATSAQEGKMLALLSRNGEQKLMACGDSWNDFTVVQIEDLRVQLGLEGGGSVWVERTQGQVVYATSSATPVALTPTPEPPRELEARQLERMWARSNEEPVGEMVPEGLRLTGGEALYKGLGLEKHDIISALNGQPVRSLEDLRSLAGECTLTVLHEGSTREVRVVFR